MQSGVVSCYVNKNQKNCPNCNSSTVSKKISLSGNKILYLGECSKCKTYIISKDNYQQNKKYINVLNPGFLIMSKRKKHKKGNKFHYSSGMEIEPFTMPYVKPPSSYKKEIVYCEFKLYDKAKDHSVSVSIQDTKKSLLKDDDHWIFSASSQRGVDCMKAIADEKQTVTIDNVLYSIRKLIVYDSKYIERYRATTYGGGSIVTANKSSKTVDFASQVVDVYVYFKLNNPCTVKKHPVENVTMKSKNPLTGKKYQVNGFYCARCKKYYINHEAVKDIIIKKMHPSFLYNLVHDYEGELKPMSLPTMYGYNAKADGPSSAVRHHILRWIVDAGLMSKAQIIKDLQFKISYNGKKTGNMAAKAKWEEDLNFMSSYTADNTREVVANFKMK